MHAASLENQFVASGFSLQQPVRPRDIHQRLRARRAEQRSGGVGASGANNIAQALANVATAGASGKITFLTRGGTTTASGTTVEEHKLWALVNSSGLKPASLSLCVVSAADGGGMSPVKSAALNGQPCPDSGTVNGTDAPSWYFVNPARTRPRT